MTLVETSGRLRLKKIPQFNLHAPIKRYAIPDFYHPDTLPAISQSLEKFLSTSTENLHKDLARLSAAILSPEQITEVNALPAEVRDAVLTIRALDRGMIGLTLREKFAFLILYSKFDNKDAPFNFYPVPPDDDFINDCVRVVNEKTERYERFVDYMGSLKQIARSHPNVLLKDKSGAPYYGGTFSEYDFWVQKQLKITAETIHRTRRRDISQETPEELRQGKSAEDLRFMFTASKQRINRLFPEIAIKDATTVRYETRLHAVGAYFTQATDGSMVLSTSETKIAQELGINQADISKYVRRLAADYRKQGKAVNLPPEGHPARPNPETIRLIELIVESINQLDFVGHRWRYNQIKYSEVTEYLNTQIFPNLDSQDLCYGIQVNENMVKNAVSTSWKHTDLLVSVPAKDILKAFREDVIPLLNDLDYPPTPANLKLLAQTTQTTSGRSSREMQLLDEIIDRLGLVSSRTVEKEKTKGTKRFEVRKWLAELAQDLENQEGTRRRS